MQAESGFFLSRASIDIGRTRPYQLAVAQVSFKKVVTLQDLFVGLQRCHGRACTCLLQAGVLLQHGCVAEMLPSRSMAKLLSSPCFTVQYKLAKHIIRLCTGICGSGRDSLLCGAPHSNPAHARSLWYDSASQLTQQLFV